MTSLFPLRVVGSTRLTFYDAAWLKTPQAVFEQRCEALEMRWHQNAARPILFSIGKTHTCKEEKQRWARHYRLGLERTAMVSTVSEAEAFLVQLRQGTFPLEAPQVGVRLQAEAAIDFSSRFNDLFEIQEAAMQQEAGTPVLATTLTLKEGILDKLIPLTTLGFSVRAPLP